MANDPKDIAEALFAEALESQEKRKRETSGEAAADEGGLDIDVDAGDFAADAADAAGDDAGDDEGGLSAEDVARFAEVEEELARVKDQLKRVDAARADNNDKFMRTLAELENFRKRAAKERQEIQRFGHENLARELLGVIDNFERALQSLPGGEGLDPQVKSFVDGIRMTHMQLVQALARFEVKPFTSKGGKFDPTRHQAMSRVPTADAEPDTIVDEMQKGYTLYDRLLRPAMVAVATPPGEAATAPAPAPQKTAAEPDSEGEPN